MIGQPLYFTPQNPYYQQQQPTYNVPSLSLQYIPNVGWRYFAVVPAPVASSAATEKLHQVSTNQLTNYADDVNKYGTKYNNNQYGHYDKYDKYENPNDRYQAKLRKYKAYELLKQKQAAQTSVSKNKRQVQ